MQSSGSKNLEKERQSSANDDQCSWRGNTRRNCLKWYQKQWQKLSLLCFNNGKFCLFVWNTTTDSEVFVCKNLLLPYFSYLFLSFSLFHFWWPTLGRKSSRVALKSSWIIPHIWTAKLDTIDDSNDNFQQQIFIWYLLWWLLKASCWWWQDNYHH